MWRVPSLLISSSFIFIFHFFFAELCSMQYSCRCLEVWQYVLSAICMSLEHIQLTHSAYTFQVCKQTVDGKIVVPENHIRSDRTTRWFDAVVATSNGSNKWKAKKDFEEKKRERTIWFKERTARNNDRNRNVSVLIWIGGVCVHFVRFDGANTLNDDMPRKFSLFRHFSFLFFHFCFFRLVKFKGTRRTRRTWYLIQDKFNSNKYFTHKIKYETIFSFNLRFHRFICICSARSCIRNFPTHFSHSVNNRKQNIN